MVQSKVGFRVRDAPCREPNKATRSLKHKHDTSEIGTQESLGLYLATILVDHRRGLSPGTYS